jgi:divalent metal cation (Fe/Co/Zn/Cd) transporter
MKDNETPHFNNAFDYKAFILSVVGAVFITAVGFWLICRLIFWLVSRWVIWELNHPHESTSLIAFLMSFSLLFSITSTKILAAFKRRIARQSPSDPKPKTLSL